MANKSRTEGKLCFLAFLGNLVLTPARKALSNDVGFQGQPNYSHKHVEFMAATGGIMRFAGTLFSLFVTCISLCRACELTLSFGYVNRSYLLTYRNRDQRRPTDYMEAAQEGFTSLYVTKTEAKSNLGRQIRELIRAQRLHQRLHS